MNTIQFGLFFLTLCSGVTAQACSGYDVTVVDDADQMFGVNATDGSAHDIGNLTADNLTECQNICCRLSQGSCNVVVFATQPATEADNCAIYLCQPLSYCSFTNQPGLIISTVLKSHQTTPHFSTTAHEVPSGTSSATTTSAPTTFATDTREGLVTDSGSTASQNVTEGTRVEPTGHYPTATSTYNQTTPAGHNNDSFTEEAASTSTSAIMGSQPPNATLTSVVPFVGANVTQTPDITEFTPTELTATLTPGTLTNSGSLDITASPSSLSRSQSSSFVITQTPSQTQSPVSVTVQNSPSQTRSTGSTRSATEGETDNQTEPTVAVSSTSLLSSQSSTVSSSVPESSTQSAVFTGTAVPLTEATGRDTAVTESQKTLVTDFTSTAPVTKPPVSVSEIASTQTTVGSTRGEPIASTIPGSPAAPVQSELPTVSSYPETDWRERTSITSTVLPSETPRKEINVIDGQDKDGAEVNATDRWYGVSTVAVLASVLSFGVVFLVAVIAIFGKRIFEGWQRRHYSRIDYLVNGMYP